MERFEFQVDKSAIMSFDWGKSKDEDQIDICIGGEKIPVVATATHLGIHRDIKTLGVESTAMLYTTTWDQVYMARTDLTQL
jgi:hypothetical protein